MRCAAMTIDVDRDVNLAEKGRIGGVSREKDGKTSPRFRSAAKGLKTIVSILDDLGIQGTFFVEAETAEELSKTVDLRGLLRSHEIAAHGIIHEDMTGADTGIKLSARQIEEVVVGSSTALRGLLRRRPVGFRAPYLHIDDAVLQVLAQEGYLYDSSIVRRQDRGEVYPYRILGPLIEAPISSGIDKEGKKIVSYLWPLHERERNVMDYEHMVSRFSAGLLVLATHSWHMVENYKDGLLTEKKVAENVEWVRTIIQGAIDRGVEFMTIEEYIGEHMGD
ncbi:MAG: polysaccharide deacetylase family protein [Methanomassiliicoccales archaeon]|nr:polysaccharide deacetylase family protein [Methanomassiliicoccales archaeon]